MSVITDSDFSHMVLQKLRLFLQSLCICFLFCTCGGRFVQCTCPYLAPSLFCACKASAIIKSFFPARKSPCAMLSNILNEPFCPRWGLPLRSAPLLPRAGKSCGDTRGLKGRAAHGGSLLWAGTEEAACP